MGNKKINIGMFLAAGVLVLGGTGCLAYQIGQVQASKQVATVERKVGNIKESAGNKAIMVDDKKTERKVLLKKEKIYLPESARIEKENKDEYESSWNGYTILYAKGGIQEKEGDISIGEAVSIAENAVAAFGGKDISGATITVSLKKNTETYGKKWVNNLRNYGVRFYSMEVLDVEEHCYDLCVNAVTGQVFDYRDSYLEESDSELILNNRVIVDGYIETELGYGAGENASDEEIEAFYEREIEESEGVYYPLAKTFIQDELGIGKVKKCYGIKVDGAAYYGLANESFTTPRIVVYCETEKGDIVRLTFDQILKKVNSFEINPLDERFKLEK